MMHIIIPFVMSCIKGVGTCPVNPLEHRHRPEEDL